MLIFFQVRQDTYPFFLENGREERREMRAKIISLCLFLFHKQKKETQVKREMRVKIMNLCLISFFFHKQKKKHTSECEKPLQYIKN